MIPRLGVEKSVKSYIHFRGMVNSANQQLRVKDQPADVAEVSFIYHFATLLTTEIIQTKNVFQVQ